MEVVCVFDEGAVLGKEFLDMKPEDLLHKF